MNKSTKKIQKIKSIHMIALITIGTICFLSTGLSIWLDIAQSKDPFIINASGRRRYLSQRIVYFTDKMFEATTDDKRKKYKAIITEALSKFKMDNNALIYGQSIAGLASSGLARVNISEKMRSLYFESPMFLDSMINHFVTLEESLLNEPEKTMNQNNPKLLELIELATGPLLDGMDEAVNLYQFESEAKVKMAQIISTFLLILVLGLLVFEKMILFSPLVKDLSYLLTQMEETILQRTKELEAAQDQLILSAKLASLGEMSAGMAHEINNPLAIIQGKAQLLARPSYIKDSEKLHITISTIIKSCSRISKIIKGLEKFSRKDNASQIKRHSLREIVNESLILIEVKLKSNNVRVELDCQIEAPVHCDQIEIEQVLVNLISNSVDAIKMISEKWIKISLFEEEHEMVLQIIDSGSGIPKNIQNKIFDPFFTTKNNGEGTGLGLSISKGILDGHKAAITLVTNSPHTCFEIRFPKIEALNKVA